MEENKESRNCLLLIRNNLFLERARYGNNKSTRVQDGLEVRIASNQQENEAITAQKDMKQPLK